MGMIGYAGAGYGGYGWHVIDGAINILLGLMIFSQLPVSGLWVIGLFIGVDLIFYGATWIAIALGAEGGGVSGKAGDLPGIGSVPAETFTGP